MQPYESNQKIEDILGEDGIELNPTEGMFCGGGIGLMALGYPGNAVSPEIYLIAMSVASIAIYAESRIMGRQAKLADTLFTNVMFGYPLYYAALKVPEYIIGLIKS